MTEFQKLNFQGNEITFKLENGEFYVCATEMAKPLGKRVNDWLRLKSSKELVKVYDDDLNRKYEIAEFKSIKIIKGSRISGLKQGTWMHADIANSFAFWLSPMLYIEYRAFYRELLKQFYTSVQSLSNAEIAQMTPEEEENNENLVEENLPCLDDPFDIQDDLADTNENQSNVESEKEIIASEYEGPEKEYTIEEIAKEEGVPIETLIKILQEHGLADENGNPTSLALENGFAAFG